MLARESRNVTHAQFQRYARLRGNPPCTSFRTVCLISASSRVSTLAQLDAFAKPSEEMTAFAHNGH
jgi:hypothetical protein